MAEWSARNPAFRPFENPGNDRLKPCAIFDAHHEGASDFGHIRRSYSYMASCRQEAVDHRCSEQRSVETLPICRFLSLDRRFGQPRPGDVARIYGALVDATVAQRSIPGSRSSPFNSPLVLAPGRHGNGRQCLDLLAAALAKFLARRKLSDSPRDPRHLPGTSGRFAQAAARFLASDVLFLQKAQPHFLQRNSACLQRCLAVVSETEGPAIQRARHPPSRLYRRNCQHHNDRHAAE